MDEFLKELYTLFYHRWIVYQLQRYHIDHVEDSEDTILFQLEKSRCLITFNPNEIIELCVTNKHKDQMEFYLHFQMNNLKHARTLFHDMMKSVYELENKSQLKILLCCSGGMTTTYFSQKINDALKLFNMDVDVQAVGFGHLYEVGNDYDMICLAPQISYKLPQVKEYIKDIPVKVIPGIVFARYDTQYMIDQIKTLMTPQSTHTKQSPSLFKNQKQGSDFVISVYQNRYKNHIDYRLYNQKQEKVLENALVKDEISLDDILGVIDSIVEDNKIETITISLPGVIHDGTVSSSFIKNIDGPLQDILEKRYHKHIHILNDVNAAAIGYHKHHSDLETFSLIFQPVGIDAGIGTIINHELYTGYYGLSGEIKFADLMLKKPRAELSLTPEGTLDMLSQMLITLSSIMAPPVFVISCDLMNDVSYLENNMNRFFHDRNIHTDIHCLKAGVLKDYVLDGLYETVLKGKDTER